MSTFQGQVVFITGAGRGQGRTHAARFAAAGAHVVGIDRDPSAVGDDHDPPDLAETAAIVAEAGAEMSTYHADVRRLDELMDVVEQVIARHGRLDVVVANAGIGGGSSGTLELTEQQWDDVVAVNLSGVWRTAKATIPPMVAAGNGGSFIIIGSTAGLRPMHGIGHYVAAKAGLTGLAKTLAIEYATHLIRVNCVHPTGVRTPLSMSASVQDWIKTRPAAGAHNLLPVDMVEPDDISDAVLWLASPQARYITGIDLPVDAGYVAS
ncbi:MAG: SDR family oxidoreductase [Ilumatobacteraceae bacterium]